MNLKKHIRIPGIGAKQTQRRLPGVALWPILGWVLFLAGWEAISRSRAVNALLFPGPSKVVLAFIDWVADGTFWGDLGSSLARVLGGLCLGTCLGVIAGVASGRIKFVGGTLGNILNALRAIPPVALVPLANRINRAIRDFVAKTALVGGKPLVLSGDCLGAIGCLAGLQKCGIRNILVWFDAHGDFHTPATTISGHLGGMPLAMITGRGDVSLLEAVGLTPLPDEQVCLVGGRDLESGEKECLEISGVRRARRVTELFDVLPDQSPLWVHFDTDYIDPGDAPAMRYPAQAGISAQATKCDLDALARKAHILGLSISAWAPHLDEESKTATTCWDVISPVLR